MTQCHSHVPQLRMHVTQLDTHFSLQQLVFVGALIGLQVKKNKQSGSENTLSFFLVLIFLQLYDSDVS